jgi:hypothetical protein
MPIDASIISQARNIPQIRYQPESQFESFAKIQPTLNAMQQMKQRAVAARGAAEIEDFMRSRGHNINLGELGALMVRVGKTEEGARLIAADNERKQIEAALGGMGLGQQATEPTGVNAMAAAPSANAMAQPAAAQPSVPSQAVTAPPMPATAPSMATQGQPAGFRTTPRQLAQLAASGQAGARVASAMAPFAEKPQPVPEKLRLMRQFGFPETQEGYRQFEEFSRAPQDTRTSDEKNYETALKGGFKGSFYEYLTGLRKAGAPNTSLNLATEKAEKVARAQQLVKDYDQVSQTARNARRSLTSIEGAQRVLDRGFTTGFGTETIGVAASVLASLGVPSAEKYATNSQAFLSAARNVLLDRQLDQKGPQTENDAKRIEESFVRLGNTTAANKFILAVAKAQAEMASAQQKAYSAYYRKNGTYDGAEEEWLAGEGSKSIFEHPSMKQFSDAAAEPTGRPSLEQILGPRPANLGK